MLSIPTLALGLSILIINTSALPVPDVLEVRDLSPGLSPRSEGVVELGSPVEKRQIPPSTTNLGLVLSLLEGHGFLPTQATLKSTSTARSIIPAARATTTARSTTPLAVAKPTTTPRSTNPMVIAKPTTTARSTTPIVIAKPTTTPLPFLFGIPTLKSSTTSTKATITPLPFSFGISTLKTSTTRATTTPKTSTSSTRATSTIRPTTTKRARGLPLPRRTPAPARAIF